MRRTRLTGSTSAIVALIAAFSLHATQGHAAAQRHHRTHASHLASASRVIQCVAFARTASDVVLPGNAVNWWQNARGVYARGTAPEVGSVLNFRANSRMRLGHVAVVTQVVDSRTIQIDQSHWHANGISRDVSVIDVSQNNDWSAVRVAIGRANTFGSIYPTFGFIYPRADRSGRIVTARGEAAPRPIGDVAPIDLRGGDLRGGDLRGDDAEVAEAPAAPSELLTDDAPNRSLR